MKKTIIVVPFLFLSVVGHSAINKAKVSNNWDASRPGFLMLHREHPNPSHNNGKPACWLVYRESNDPSKKNFDNFKNLKKLDNLDCGQTDAGFNSPADIASIARGRTTMEWHFFSLFGKDCTMTWRPSAESDLGAQRIKLPEEHCKDIGSDEKVDISSKLFFPEQDAAKFQLGQQVPEENLHEEAVDGIEMLEFQKICPQYFSTLAAESNAAASGTELNIKSFKYSLGKDSKKLKVIVTHKNPSDEAFKLELSVSSLKDVVNKKEPCELKKNDELVNPDSDRESNLTDAISAPMLLQCQQELQQCRQDLATIPRADHRHDDEAQGEASESESPGDSSTTAEQ